MPKIANDQMAAWTRRLPKVLLLLGLFWFIWTFLAYPVFEVLRQALWVDGHFNAELFQRILGSERAMTAIKNSLFLAVILTITANVVGTLLVLFTDYFQIKGAKILRLAYMSTLFFGGLILNNGYLFVYGEGGIVTRGLMKLFPGINPGWFTGFTAVIFVMTFGCTHNHMIFLRNAIQGLDNNIIDAAKNLGASPFQILKDVVFPSLKPTFLTLIIMVFATGLGAFAAPLMVGGQAFQTMSPLILTFAQRPSSRNLAALMSLFLGLAQVLLLLALNAYERRGNYLSVAKTQTHFEKQKIENPLLRVGAHILAYALFVIYALPPVMIVAFSFMSTRAISTQTWSLSEFTLKHYQKIVISAKTYGPLLRSILFSGLAAVVAVFLMLFVVRLVMDKRQARWLKALEFPFYIPWLLPSILLALGYLLAYDKPSALLLGQSVIGNPWILPVAYGVIVLPVTIRYLKSAYYNFDHHLEDASRNLGASSFTTFRRIIVPALLPTMLALIALNFNTNLAEYNMSAFLYQPGWEPIGVVIRNNAAPTATIDGKAINLVYSVILMITSALALYLVYGRGTALSERRQGR